MFIFLARIVLLNSLLLFSGFSYAQNSSLLPAQQVIEQTSNVLLEALKDKTLANDKVRVREFVDKNIFPQVDIIRMSALVLGKHWRKANKLQQTRFITAFKALLVNTYASTFTEQFNDWHIDYLAQEAGRTPDKVTVKTRVNQSGKASAKIDYSMVYRNNHWKIYDIKVEGISLVISNRSTFSQLIKQSGNLDAVINELETKNLQ